MRSHPRSWGLSSKRVSVAAIGRPRNLKKAMPLLAHDLKIDGLAGFLQLLSCWRATRSSAEL